MKVVLNILLTIAVLGLIGMLLWILGFAWLLS